MGCDLAWDVQTLDESGKWQTLPDAFYARHPPPDWLLGRYKQIWADLLGRVEAWGTPSAHSLTVKRSEPINPSSLGSHPDDEFASWPTAIVLADLAAADWPQGSPILTICDWLGHFGSPDKVRLLLAVEP